jgi:hypothetical protein
MFIGTDCSGGLFAAVTVGDIRTHYWPVHRKRTVSEHLTYNSFLAILGAVDLKWGVIFRTLFRGATRLCIHVMPSQ